MTKTTTEPHLLPLTIQITREMRQVIDSIVERIANNELGPLSTMAGMIDSPKIGPLIESILRANPGVDLVREELRVEWKHRNPPGRVSQDRKRAKRKDGDK